MSGRAPQKPPKNALKIRVESSAEEQQIFEWVTVGNGFPFYVPVLSESDLFLSRDGRTLYGKKFLVRTPSPWNRPQTGRVIGHWRDTYALTPEGTDLVRKRFAYPIVRSLWDYAPGVAARIGLPPRTVTLHLSFDGERETCPRCGEQAASPLTVKGARVGYACAACRKVGTDD